jgi:4-amino-4-deoxy-L-arabinose transferase-like glycosyltransferase
VDIKKWGLLILILCLAFFLRFYKVTEVPPSLNWDEVSIGYNAYSILETGRDEWGEFLPVHFKSYGEYKLPAQIYASIPAIALFGLNDFSVRITPVIYGTLTVLFLYFLTFALFKRKSAALAAAFFLSISPWHIQLTRGSFESSFATMWIVLGIWFLVKGFQSRKWFLISMIPFAIAVYTYNTARIFVPLFLFTSFLLFAKDFWKFKKTIIVSMILFFVLMIPFIQFVLGGGGNARYKLVSITDDPGLIPRIEERRNNSSLPGPLPQLIHNRVSYIGFYFGRNYLSHFSPQFLFLNGAPHKQHHVQGVGELYLIQAPLLLVGLYALFRFKNRFRYMLIAWPLLTLIPVSITQDSMPHALRTLIMNPFFQILSGYGLMTILDFLKKINFSHAKYLFQATVGFGIMVLGVNFAVYLYNFYVVYPVMYSRDWQYGNTKVVEYIKQNQEKYDLIVYTRHFGEPHMFTLFYTQFPPEKYFNNPNLERFETFDWVRVLRFGKYYFPDLGDEGTQYKDIVERNPDKKILFIGKPGDFPEEAARVMEVNFLNGKPAFELVERN